VVRAVNDCMPGPWSMEWAVRGGGGSNVALLTNANTIHPALYTSQRAFQRRSCKPRGNTNVQQPAAHTISPQPNPTPQPGFFQKIWHGILGVFGIK